MKALLMIVLLATGSFCQEQPKLVGEIEFFGYAGSDLKRLKASLPFQEGNEFNISGKGELAKITVQAAEAVKKTAGHPATDIAPVCCDKRGNWMIYIGLSGKTARYRAKPKGDTRLPASVVSLYERFMSALRDAAARGAAEEDHSAGYALSIDPSLRQTQLEMREYALKHGALLFEVLENSSDNQHRIVAAEILGYARQSKMQIMGLANAGRDIDSSVRNNATRALYVLVESDPKLALDIPDNFFVDQLLSGKWTDLNKASLLLSSITASRNEKVLSLLRSREVRERLIEMARWRTGHAEAARYLLGRIAGIDEDRLKLLVTEGKTEEVINSVAPR